MKPKSAGFIALISVLLISGALIMTAITSGARSLFEQLDSLETHIATQNYLDAQSCIDQARLLLSEDISTTMPNDNCVLELSKDEVGNYDGYVVTSSSRGQTTYAVTIDGKKYTILKRILRVAPP